MTALVPDPVPHRGRRRLRLRDELLMAALPTATVLLVLVMVDTFSQQRLLFSSLAVSSFLIYLDPLHQMNKVRTLVISQVGAASLGLALFLAFGPGYAAAGIAMVVTIVLMVVVDLVHPPAIATAMSFALRAGNERSLVIFILAVGMTATLVVLQRAVLWAMRRGA